MTAELDGRTFAAVVDGDLVRELPAPDVGTWLRRPGWQSAPDVGTSTYPWADVRPAPVIPRPSKIVCVGLNFATHIAEMGRPRPAYPTLFAKFARALIGARDDIVVPTAAEQLDYEAELAVVIGAGGRHIARADALHHVAGYTVMNDVTARTWQYRTTQWLQGKTFESTTPLGPVLVTPDELGRIADLEIHCAVDGVPVQHSSLADLVFDPVDVISYLSTIVTLDPGDVIALGTPGGVAHASAEPRWLVPGATVTSAVDGIGMCENSCVAE